MKYRYPVFALLLTAALLCPLTGCGNPQEPAQSVQTDSPSASQPVLQPEAHPFTLAFYPNYSTHPALAENRANLSLAPLLYEGLFRLDEQFNAVPVLCQTYQQSENGLSWVFTLRPGVVFSDGTPLTGTIAAQALNTARSAGSRYAGRFTGVHSITGDDTTVTITLITPNNALPTLLDIPIALDDSSRPLGTGSYYLEEHNTGSFLLTNKQWWQNLSLPFDSIQLFTIQQADDLIAAFDSGDITLLDADLTGTNALGYSGSYEVWNYNTTDFIYLGFNTKKGYCKDAAVRQAISQGIDRTSISTIPYARHAAASSLPFHPDSSLYDADLARQMDYAPEALVEFLAAAALPKQPLKLLVNSENSFKIAAAESIALTLNRYDFDVTVVILDWEEYLYAIAEGNFDLYYGECKLGADWDLTPLLGTEGILNYGGYTHLETEALLLAAKTAAESQRSTALMQLSRHLQERCPLIPLGFKQVDLMLPQGAVDAVTPTAANPFYALELWQVHWGEPVNIAGE